MRYWILFWAISINLMAKWLLLPTLLGYKVKGDTLDLVQTNDQNTLLKSFLNTLSISLDLISEIDYNNGNNHIIDVGQPNFRR